jgi:hypothetical protein
VSISTGIAIAIAIVSLFVGAALWRLITRRSRSASGELTVRDRIDLVDAEERERARNESSSDAMQDWKDQFGGDK